jgi:hypothetical protein
MTAREFMELHTLCIERRVNFGSAVELHLGTRTGQRVGLFPFYILCFLILSHDVTTKRQFARQETLLCHVCVLLVAIELWNLMRADKSAKLRKKYAAFLFLFIFVLSYRAAL